MTPQPIQHRFSYPELLLIAQGETKELQARLRSLNGQYFELGQLRNRVDLYNLEAFHQQRKQLFAEIIFVEADLRRSQGREEMLRRWIDEGKIKGQAQGPVTVTIAVVAA